MTIPSWPASLPSALLVRGYSESLPDVTLRTQMDAGPAKVRRRFTAGVRPVSGRQVMTAAQVAALRTFYETTLLGGSLRFSWREPRAGDATVEFRFTEPPQWSGMEPGLFDVSLSLEIMP